MLINLLSFRFGELSIQIVICSLTLVKTKRITHGWAWSSAPTLSSVLKRDALYVSMAITGDFFFLFLSVLDKFNVN